MKVTKEIREKLEAMAKEYGVRHVANGEKCCDQCGQNAIERREWVEWAYSDGAKAALELVPDASPESELAKVTAERDELLKIMSRIASAPVTQMADEISKLEAENERLGEQVEALLAVAEFYGDREHWNISDPSGAAHVIHSSDVDELKWGGKFARETLEQLAGEK